MSSHDRISDTNPEAEGVLIDLIRRQSPVERLQKMVQQSNQVRQQCRNAIRRRFPEFSEEEVGFKLIELNYGEELAAAVREWRKSARHQQ